MGLGRGLWGLEGVLGVSVGKVSEMILVPFPPPSSLSITMGLSMVSVSSLSVCWVRGFNSICPSEPARELE